MSNCARHNLNFHSDVGSVAPVNGEVLTFDGPSGMWVAKPVTITNVPHSIEEHTDINISSPVLNQVLAWDGTDWVNATTPGGPIALDDVTDVVIAGATTNQVLAFNGTNWENVSVASVFPHTLDFHSDVNVPSPTLGQLLTYNGSAWVAQALNANLTALSDVTITSPVSNHVLRYNGSQWINGFAPAVTTASHSLGSHSDVNIPAPDAGDILSFDGTNWVATVPASGANAVGSKTEVSLKLLRGTLKRTGNTWAVEEGVGFAMSSPGPGTASITFAGLFSDVPSVSVGFSSSTETLGGETYFRLSPAVEGLTTGAVTFFEQLLAQSSVAVVNITGETHAIDAYTHFTIVGPVL